MPSFSIKFLSLFSIHFSKSTELIMKPGETVLAQEWSWRKFGYIKKFYLVDENGKLNVIRP